MRKDFVLIKIFNKRKYKIEQNKFKKKFQFKINQSLESKKKNSINQKINLMKKINF